jgi:O-antigen/teichoic acid export membrane protein
MILFAEPVIDVYLGLGWRPAGTILVILAPMLAVRSTVMSLATTVFVLKRPAWLLWHNVASVVAMGGAFGIALATRASLLTFVTLLSALQGLEYAVFGIILIIASRCAHFHVAAGPRNP